MRKIVGIWSVIFGSLLYSGCSPEDSPDSNPFIIFKEGPEYTHNGDSIPVGGLLKFGFSAVGGGSAITNLRVERITTEKIVTEIDRGIYVETGGLDTVLSFTKSDAPVETWSFFIMNANRDTALMVLTIFKGDGSAYGAIHYYPSIFLSFQDNEDFPNFIDLDAGIGYSGENVAGHEFEIDLAAFWYLTSNKSSPTFTCPGYPSAQTYYPQFENWPVKNSTLYDYKTTDNDLISGEEFDAAVNDSLLVNGYKPENVSGQCKFCYTGKIIPFKTAGGKYGLIKVIRADETASGSMEIAIKIQK